MVADRIKTLREENQMTQAELARRLSITRASVNAWEMGISAPSTQYIVELAGIFHISTDCNLCILFLYVSHQRIKTTALFF